MADPLLGSGAIAYASPLAGSILDRVNQELRNYTERGIFKHTVDTTEDDSLSVFQLPHQNIATSAATINGTTATHTLEGDAGYITLATPAANTNVLLVTYTYRFWNDTMVKQAILSGVEALWEKFYVMATDETLSTVAGTYEYALPALSEVVRAVEWRASSSDPWKTLRGSRYTLFTNGQTKTLRFYENPTAGSLRLHLVKRVAPFAADTDLTGTVGLPDRAVEPIVNFACYKLIKELQAKRVRIDKAIATQGSGFLSPRQLADSASQYYLAYQVSLADRRMKPWSRM